MLDHALRLLKSNCLVPTITSAQALSSTGRFPFQSPKVRILIFEQDSADLRHPRGQRSYRPNYIVR
jgi:hypothetical protein